MLSSSALTIQVEPVARFRHRQYPDQQVRGRPERLADGQCDPADHLGPGKADAVQEFAAERGIDLQESYFYADGDEDVALMYLVGKPRPTNPGDKMAEVARKRAGRFCSSRAAVAAA